MRILLTLRYDGTAYHGWQVQKNALSVQTVIQNGIERVFGERIGVTGCSRTDAGVHANMYCCHFDCESCIPTEKIPAAISFYLPKDISVMNARVVDPNFHARYSAAAKEYIYKIHSAPWRDPFLLGYALHSRHSIDCVRMNENAAVFLGTHDFRAFMSAGSDIEDTRRTIFETDVTKDGSLVVFRVLGDGFLYNMVRIMAGTLLFCEMGRIDPKELPSIIESGDRERAGKTAPAYGLYLNRVIYGEDNK